MSWQDASMHLLLCCYQKSKCQFQSSSQSGTDLGGRGRCVLVSFFFVFKLSLSPPESPYISSQTFAIWPCRAWVPFTQCVLLNFPFSCGWFAYPMDRFLSYTTSFTTLFFKSSSTFLEMQQIWGFYLPIPTSNPLIYIFAFLKYSLKLHQALR
jgi:hypothetical protein